MNCGMSSGRLRSGGMKRHDVEPIVKVGPEALALNFAGKIAIGGDDPDVRILISGRTDAPKATLLEEVKHLDLHQQRHVPNFVEEEA